MRFAELRVAIDLGVRGVEEASDDVLRLLGGVVFEAERFQVGDAIEAVLAAGATDSGACVRWRASVDLLSR
ncbi:MAG: hypothetical protein CMJ89_20525 [Planctomycetes bacterium]|nr:hypothetical protein [Planctomycetota bacterium]